MQLRHPYTNIGRGGWFPPAPWRPDGQWLASVAESQNANERGLWLLAPGNSQEIYAGPYRNPTWSPDGRWLAVVDEQGQHWLLEADSQYPLQLDLPADAIIQEWR